MDNWENQNIEQDSYKTGSTNPPKNRGGLVAGLLVAVILLAGVSSILGVMNIQLFRMLKADKESFASFSPTEGKNVTPEPTPGDSGELRLGLTGENISELDQRYFHLPAGVLISAIDERGCAAKAGLAVGDIIVSFNGVNVLSVEELEQALQACQTGDRVEVVFYRYRTEKELKTTVALDVTNGQ
ncbi:MAG: PDZ domain-containing protein [Oscillospiraceae bacterium]|nr:PDZ domain-containing protein [Oscillospiraceae bacterium]